MWNIIPDIIKAITGKLNWNDAPRIPLEHAADRRGDTFTGPVSFTDTVNLNRKQLNQPQVKAYTEALLTDVGVITSKSLDISISNVFDLTLTGDVTLSFISLPPAGQAASITLLVKQGLTPRVITWPSLVKWAGDTAPDISGVNRAYVLTLFTLDGGVTWFGMAAGSFNALTGSPDLTIAGTHTGAPPQGSTGNQETVTVTNSGTNMTSSTITVTVTLPTGLTPTAASGTGWTTIISGQTVTATRSTALQPGTSSAFIITFSVSASAPSTVTITGIVSTTGESNPNNNSFTDAMTIAAVV